MQFSRRTYGIEAFRADHTRSGLTELHERIDGMHGVSVTAAGINLAGELTLTLSDGTVLTPGVVVGREELKRARAEPVDLPNVLEARRWR